MSDPTGEADTSALRLDFDRRLLLQFRGSTITSDAGLLAYRELDDALHLTDTAADRLADARTGKNGRHRLAGLLRQSVFGRLAGYENVNDAERLCRDPAMRWVVGDQAISRLKEAHVVEISHEIKIKATPDHIFAALTKVDELKAWHSSHVSGQAQPGEILHIEGSGKPGFD